MKKLMVMLACAGLIAGCSHSNRNSGAPGETGGATGGTWDTTTGNQYQPESGSGAGTMGTQPGTTQGSGAMNQKNTGEFNTNTNGTNTVISPNSGGIGTQPETSTGSGTSTTGPESETGNGAGGSDVTGGAR